MAFRDLEPKAPTHVLVVPRRHVPDLAGLATASAEELADVVGLAARGRRAGRAAGLPHGREHRGGGAAERLPRPPARHRGSELTWPPG